MLEVSGIVIPDLIFSGWDLPVAIDVYYYEDPETKNRISSGFSVVYPIEKEGMMTEEWMKKLKEFRLESATIKDKNNSLGVVETLYTGLMNSSIEKDDQTITFGFACDRSTTFLKPIL